MDHMLSPDCERVSHSVCVGMKSGIDLTVAPFLRKEEREEEATMRHDFLRWPLTRLALLTLLALSHLRPQFQCLW